MVKFKVYVNRGDAKRLLGVEDTRGGIDARMETYESSIDHEVEYLSIEDYEVPFEELDLNDLDNFVI